MLLIIFFIIPWVAPPELCKNSATVDAGINWSRERVPFGFFFTSSFTVLLRGVVQQWVWSNELY